MSSFACDAAALSSEIACTANRCSGLAPGQKVRVEVGFGVGRARGRGRGQGQGQGRCQGQDLRSGSGERTPQSSNLQIQAFRPSFLDTSLEQPELEINALPCKRLC